MVKLLPHTSIVDFSSDDLKVVILMALTKKWPKFQKRFRENELQNLLDKTQLKEDSKLSCC